MSVSFSGPAATQIIQLPAYQATFFAILLLFLVMIIQTSLRECWVCVISVRSQRTTALVCSETQQQEDTNVSQCVCVSVCVYPAQGLHKQEQLAYR